MRAATLVVGDQALELVMITSALLPSNRLPEQLLLSFDAAVYCVCATLTAVVAGDIVFGALIVYLAGCTAVASHRHVTARRAACNQGATADGQVCGPPTALDAANAGSQPRTPWAWFPALALLLAALLSMYTPFQHVAPVMAFVAAEAHFILLRVHGDCRGGKHAPTLFVLFCTR